MRDISYTTTTATRQPDRRRLVIFNDAASASTNGTYLRPSKTKFTTNQSAAATCPAVLRTSS